MVKKSSSVKKKKTSRHKTVKKSHITQTSSEIKIEKILVENFVSLQKVMVNLSIKFDNLTNQISKLLELFEISAKALAEKEFSLEQGNRDDKKIIEKIDNLLDQNKTIARGLTLLHEPVLEQKTNYPPVQKIRQIPYTQPPKPTIPQQNIGADEYKKSISSEHKEFNPPPKN